MLLTVTEFRPDRADVNEVIYDIAAENDNVRVVDWAAETADDPALVGGDGLHLSDLGRARYADLVGRELGRAPGFGEGDCLGSDFTDDSAVTPQPGQVTMPPNTPDQPGGGGGGGGGGGTATPPPVATTPATTVAPAVPTTVTAPEVTQPPAADHAARRRRRRHRRPHADDAATAARRPPRRPHHRPEDAHRRPARFWPPTARPDLAATPTVELRQHSLPEPTRATNHDSNPSRNTRWNTALNPRGLDTVLQAQGLAVSVGGRLVVEGADFTVMPKDKVGLVGRNGAGKTSLFRVLGGHAEPAAGRVIRKGGFGYLPQDPRVDAAADARTAVTHVLSGRGVDAEIERIEKLRIAMEEHPDERAVARYSRAEELFRANGGYAAESEAQGDRRRSRARLVAAGSPDRRALRR